MDDRSQKRFTIYDVASRAGVSITTVSRYLNNGTSVKEATADRIREAMEYYDYVPQGNAGTAAAREVRRIGVMTPFFPAPSFVQRLEGMLPVFKGNNYEMIVYTVESDEQLDEYTRSVPFTRRLDGLVLMSFRLNEAQRKRLLAAGLPTVFMECRDPSFSNIYIDNVTGGRLAARHLLKKGLFPCAYLGDDPPHEFSLDPSRDRLEGFREELALGGYQLDEHRIHTSVTNVESAHAEALRILGAPDRPRSLFAMSDIQAIGVIQAARELGLSLPDDLALIGFDNTEASGWMGITTIDQHLIESGRIIATMLVDRIQNPSRPVQSLQLSLDVVERVTA